MRTAVVRAVAVSAPVESGRPICCRRWPSRKKPRIGESQDENDEGSHLHVVRLDLLAEILRRATDHQAGDEDRDDHIDQHAVKTRADAAEDDFAELDIQQRHETADRMKESCAYRVDRAAGGVRGDGGEEGGIEDAEADFLALHVAIGGIDTQGGKIGIAGRLKVPGDHDAGEEEGEHCRPHRPTVALVLDRSAKVVSQRARNRKDREDLQEVRERRRVFERMRGISIDVAAAIRSEHFDRDLRGHRALHDGLRIDFLIDQHRLAVRGGHRIAFVIDLRHRNGERVAQGGGLKRLEILDHALRHEHDRENDADGKQQVVGDANEIDPEIADGL